MTRDEAKQILQCYRPSGADAADPMFADALRLAQTDAELGQWFSAQQQFDSAMTRACAGVSAPAALRERLLAARAVPARRWWNRPLRRGELALAAAIALLAAIGGFYWLAPRESFADFREEAVEQSWAGARHVDFETSDLSAIRGFIAANGGLANFKLPPELAAMRPRGCAVLSVKGRPVPYICFVGHSSHVHLAVMDAKLRDDPFYQNMPEFSKWQNWDAVTWQNGDAAYTLSGMKPQQVVKKFRKERQWDWGG
jgi:hypothetical protein